MYIYIMTEHMRIDLSFSFFASCCKKEQERMSRS